MKDGTEDRFRAAWAQVTLAIRGRFGTGGSRLHRAADGTHYAYAVWPSRDAWSSASGASADPQNADVMRACVDERFPAVELDVIEDLLAPDGQR